MLKHEEKICPRCKANFECKVGSIVLCQCSKVKLTETERDHLRQCFTDCLCANCMQELKADLNNRNFTSRLKKIFGMR
jgi:hypothetical protein